MKIEDEIKQAKFNNAQTKALINIIFTASRINDKFAILLKPFDLTQPQYNVLRILRGRNGEPANCGDIKRVMVDKNPDVTRICDKLMQKDLINRKFNHSNRREVLISITDSGLDLLHRVDPLMDQAILSMVSLNDEELLTLSGLLDAIRS